MTKKRPGLFLHILFWALYVLSEYFANLYHLKANGRLLFIGTTLLSLPILMAPTYFLSWVAVPRFLRQGQWLNFALAVLAIMLLVFYARIYWEEWVNYFRSGHHINFPASKMMKNIIRDYATISLATCISIIADWKQKQQQNEQLIKAKAEAEIKLLKAQLHPHFLFNTLNNIYSLALQKSDLTADSILKLTELMDYLVYWANKEKVNLAKEVQLLQNYLDLEQLRHGDKLMLETTLHIQHEVIKVAPLILLPFVENCFKHGGKGKDGQFHIRIELQVEEQLHFLVRNSKPIHPKKTNGAGGLGLENLRKRLDLLYPQAYHLDIEDEKAYFQIRLQLRLN